MTPRLFAYTYFSVVKEISPTIARLRTFKSNREPYKRVGNKSAKLTKPLAIKFCNLIAESDDSLFNIIKANPDLPTFYTLWNAQSRLPWFSEMWKAARIRQTHFLAQKCIELYRSAEPKTAHVVRIKFDILKWFCAKFNPEVFADKPATGPVQTVNVGVNISPERLSDLRSKLVPARTAFLPNRASTDRKTVAHAEPKELAYDHDAKS